MAELAADVAVEEGVVSVQNADTPPFVELERMEELLDLLPYPGPPVAKAGKEVVELGLRALRIKEGLGEKEGRAARES